MHIHKNKARVIAFYLPQFHEIRENNEWWGDGFTEWTNVRKSKPLFAGHYQPHEPSDGIGYYDLKDKHTQEKQIDLAKQNGIDGFCYYHYWFHGKQLLEKPLKRLLEDKELDFPFCVCWANETWSRSWDGQDHEILIEQKFSPEDDVVFIQNLIPYFRDERYIRINGKPLLLVWRTEKLPDPKATVKRWQQQMKVAGLPPLYLVRVGSHEDNIVPGDHGFGAAVEFAPDWRNLGMAVTGNKEFDKYKDFDRKITEGRWPKVFDYELTMQNMLMKPLPEYKLFRGVFPSWDNTPRRAEKGTVFINSSPENFKYFLQRQLQNTYKNFEGDERLLFINAWNEWGEGCHLEPDKKFGMAYLEACKEMTDKSEEDILKENDLMNQIVNLEVTLTDSFCELRDLSQKMELLRKHLAEETRKKDEIIAKKDEEISEKVKEINFVKSSKFWKLRELNFKIKFAVFHPLRFLRKISKKIKYLYYAAKATLKREGMVNMAKRSLNYIRYGKGVLKKNGIRRNPVKNISNCDLFDFKNVDKKFKPKVSIIVPNYNHEKYLRQRLDSIYSQTYDNFEVILLDDCSTDESRKILLEYANKYKDKTRYIFNEKNSGSVFIQWERGIAEATGELIWIAESDDYCSDNLISSMVKYFSDESVMLAYCRTVFEREDSKVWTTETHLSDIDEEKWKSDFVESAHRIVNDALGKVNIIANVSSAIFRHPGEMHFTDKEKWRSLRFCGDWVFYLHVIRGGAMAYTTKATNYYRQHEKNTSTLLHAKDVYYTEHEYVAMTVAELYAVSSKIFDEQQKSLQDYWKLVRKKYDADAFKKCYDIEKIKAYQKKRKPNIAMFGFAFSAGGGETFPIILSNALYEHGYGVTFIDCNLEKRELGVRKMLNPSIPVIKLSNQSMLSAYMRIFGIEILHSQHGSVDVVISEAMEDLPNCRQVVTMHGMYEMQNNETLKNNLPVLLEKVNQWVYTTDKNLDAFKKLNLYQEDKFTKIGNALAHTEITPVSRKSLGIAEDAFVLCLVSRAIPEKGWEEAIRCVGQARERSGGDIQLIIIGDGEERGRLEKKSPDHIHFLGFKKNIRDYYAMSDMGFVPSRFQGESFPLVIIDSLYSGKPVLSSNIGEVKSMLKTGEEDFAGAIFDLVDWKIPEDDLTKLIVRCAIDEKYYNKMLAEVEAAAKKFDIENVFSEYASCYQKVLGQDKRKKNQE
jgi:lipopolysaccharide biosynthesis protein/glycosyltransferase involved in cell wall biosynthesis